MLWFMRLTGDGVGMHVGILPGYPVVARLHPHARAIGRDVLQPGENRHPGRGHNSCAGLRRREPNGQSKRCRSDSRAACVTSRLKLSRSAWNRRFCTSVFFAP